MNWSQIPPWLWALMPLAAFLIYVLRQRPIAANPWSERRFASRRTVGMNEWPQRSVSAPPAANDPYLQLHQEILRGLLRKEGIVLPPPDEPRSKLWPSSPPRELRLSSSVSSPRKRWSTTSVALRWLPSLS